ncbi:hypothetical protein LT330_009158 [Penicillium expansum]|nr:hypothetical protein LT330_009158 [Penicillium expansum]
METFLQPRSNVENRGPLLMIINGTVASIAAIIVILRVISRTFIVKMIGLDDWIMVVATIFTILNVVVEGLGVSHGIGKHKWDLNQADELPIAKLEHVTRIFYTLISGLIKVSICLLYLRVFPNMRLISLGTITFITAMSVAIILATIFQCSPIDAVFDQDKYKHYTCFASIPFWYTTAALFLLTDIWILLLPLKTVLGLQLQTRKRFVVAVLLSLGSFQHHADGLPCEILEKLRPLLGYLFDFCLVRSRTGCRYHRCQHPGNQADREQAVSKAVSQQRWHIAVSELPRLSFKQSNSKYSTPTSVEKCYSTLTFFEERRK